MEKIKTVCSRDCPDTCFIDVTVEKGQILKIRGCADNPVTQGFICPRGNGDSKRVYSQKRVLYPFVKPDEQDSEDFLQVSWDEALSKIAEMIGKTIVNHGNETLLLYDYPGNQGFLSWQFPRRLWMALGATTTYYSLCSSSGHAGIGLHYGLTYGIQPENLLESKIIIFWGNNAKVSSPHQWALASKARKTNAAIIISIDPRKSETSQASDIWIQPRPGSDVALGYGLARYLIQNNGVDKNFLDEWATGFQEYSEEALRWTPDRVEKVTWVSTNLIEKVGDLFIQSGGPTAFMIGLGLQKSLQGAQAARAVSLLPAIMGYHRGFHYSDSNGRNVDWDDISGASRTLTKGRTVNQVSIGERLARGEFRFIFVLGSNPAITLPDQSTVRQGLKRKDVFVVVQDGKIVAVFNDFGNVVLKANVTDKISTGTLLAPRPLTGLNGEPLNSLAPGVAQKIGGGPIFNSIKVKIK